MLDPGPHTRGAPGMIGAMSASTLLVGRLHVDLLRVASAVCMPAA